MYKKILATVALALSALTASAVPANFSSCSKFFANATAPRLGAAQPGQQRELCFDAFAVLHSGQAKTPLYVAERLTAASVRDAQDEERTNRFYEEARLPSAERARLVDYKSYVPAGTERKHFDRGHMAPAADMPNAQAMAQSFSLANMVPQAPQNNRKTWLGLEKATRKYVLRASGDVYVISGPVFVAPVATLGPNRVWVPNHLFKLVYDASANRAWAHWVDNTDDARVGKPISYAELVRRTGIEFLPGVRPRD